MKSMSAKPGRGAKAPGFVFSALAAGLSVLLIAALSPSQPPPPPVAEYAPEAVQALKDAPPEQSAENGLTDGSEQGDDTASEEEEEQKALGPSSTTTTTEKEVLPPNSERVRRCVANPDGTLRQTEDPQSPPCVPFWEGDNGGRIGSGVTPNEIRFVIPNGTEGAIQDALINFLNRRFEFYGRRLVNIGGACFGATTPADAQAHAIGVAKQDTFGSLGFCDIKGPTSAYYDELARRGVVSVDMQPSNRTEKELSGFHPYEWTYLPTFDKGSRHLGELACSLNGLPAEHGGPDVSGKTRKWGLFTNTYKNAPSPDLTSIKAAFASCGIEVLHQQVVVAESSQGGQGVTEETTSQVQNGVFAMKQEGVTSVIALTHTETTKQIYLALDAQTYTPEVLVSTYLFNDEDLFIGAQPKTQSAHTFGISVWNKPVRVADEFWYQAVQEVSPGFDFPYKPFTYYGARNVYVGLLMLAAGVQLAGPHLTPASFAAGLQRAKWANPPHKNMPGKVTVSPGTHSYMEDAAVIWWNPSSSSEEYGTNGGFCYVDHGRRRRLGGYKPGDPGLFEGDCGRYD